MATVGGAEALGLETEIGSLEVGKSADLIVVHAEASNMLPVYNEYAAIVYAMNSKNILSTMVGGEWLMKNRQLLTLDKDAIVEEMKALGARIKK